MSVKMPAYMSGMRNARSLSRMKKPIPSFAATISEITVRDRAIAREMRIPATMFGEAEGSTIFQRISRVVITTREILWKIVLPSASPNIVAGMRISLAIALSLTVISEMVAANDGIGFFILDSERAFRIPDMYAGIFTLMVVGYF